jgi:hypothetical protein
MTKPRPSVKRDYFARAIRAFGENKKQELLPVDHQLVAPGSKPLSGFFYNGSHSSTTFHGHFRWPGSKDKGIRKRFDAPYRGR